MKQQTIAIDTVVAAWLEKQPKKRPTARWESDPLTDKKILAGWSVMNKGDLAKAFGVCEDTVRRRYRELTEGKA